MPVLRPMLSILSALILLPTTALAQVDEEDAPRRTRIALGPQVAPSYPGADSVSLRPLFDLSRARGDQEFAFEAPDESFGFALLRTGGFTLGPSVGFEGERTAQDVGAALPKVGISVELGGFAQYQLSEDVRFSMEARQAVSGHDGFIALFGADYVIRDGDRQLISVGPRLTVTDETYQNAYFGVTPQAAIASGLPAFDAGGGVQAIGAAVGYIRQFTPRWGLYGYAKYDRLIGDAADSPIVARFGSRDQASSGIALTYTFGEGINR